ncbi:MAG TPA: SPFH domain-containing protein [Methanosarcina sp.]|nr:SPFH domain-containing protein [Methanosarcina sp.]
MKKVLVVGALLGFALLGSGCTRVATGEIGLREGFDKQVQKGELQPGSFNQVLVGDVLVFPVKQLMIDMKNLQPQTADHTNLKELDLQVVYNINPASVWELYTTKSHGMNAIDSHGDTLLMYSYLQTVINSAAQKAVSKYNALDVPVKRTDIEVDVRKAIEDKLKDEKLDTALLIDQVTVRNAVPADAIVQSATQVINAQNALRAKQVELQTAQIEAQRQDLLSRPANIAYMNAQAALNISEGVRDGKVQTVLIPHNMTMFGGAGK